MKLLIAADIFPPESGGPATYAVTLAKELTKQGDQVVIVSLNPNSDRSTVSCFLFPVSFQNKLLRYFQYLYLLFKHSKAVDVIYAMGPVNAGFPAWLAARLRRKKLVVKVVGDYAWEQSTQRFGVTDSMAVFQKQRHYSAIVQFLKWLESFVVRHADRVIVPSDYLRGIVLGWGAKADQVEIVYNAVELKVVAAVAKPNEERWIVSVGRLVPWKGMEALVSIASEIITEHPNLKLKIIGDGPEREKLRLKIEDLRLKDCVELLGNLPREQTLSFIHAADVFVLNSGYEGLSHVLLEALSFSRPVLVSDVGGNPEIIIKNQTGDLFEYNNHVQIREKIREFLQNPSLHLPKLNTDDLFFDRFKLSTMIAKTKQTLEKVCAN